MCFQLLLNIIQNILEYIKFTKKMVKTMTTLRAYDKSNKIQSQGMNAKGLPLSKMKKGEEFQNKKHKIQ